MEKRVSKKNTNTPIKKGQFTKHSEKTEMKNTPVSYGKEMQAKTKKCKIPF